MSPGTNEAGASSFISPQRHSLPLFQYAVVPEAQTWLRCPLNAIRQHRGGTRRPSGRNKGGGNRRRWVSGDIRPEGLQVASPSDLPALAVALQRPGHVLAYQLVIDFPA